MPPPPDVRKCMQQIEKLVGEIEKVADPHLRARAVELVQLLMEMHGTGIERILTLVHESSPQGNDLIAKISEDALVGSLLLLYGLHPLGLEMRVRQALDQVRPYLASHGGDVDLLRVDENGQVYLRLQGSCRGCPSSEMTLKLAIEEAIYEQAPDVGGLHVEGVVKSNAPPQSLVQLSSNGKP